VGGRGGGGVSAPSHTWQAVWAIRLKVARDRVSSARATPDPPSPVPACPPLDACDASASGQSDALRDAPNSSQSTPASPPATPQATPQATLQATPQATPPAKPQATPPRRRQSSPPRPAPPRSPAGLAARGGNASAASVSTASSPCCVQGNEASRASTPSKGRPPPPTHPPTPHPSPTRGPTRAPPKHGVRGVRALLPAQSSACEVLDHPSPRLCPPNRPSPRRST
jgi:hypothetical protein